MIGTGDAEYVRMVFDYADKLGVRNRVVWQERMEQKYLSNVYSLADFFLLPTEYEIFGMVLLEAMYYKTVVLTTRNGGSSTIMQEGINGYVVEDKNVIAWSEKIIETYHDKNNMQEIKDNASKTVAVHYTWDALADKFLEQYLKKLSS